MNLNLLEEDPYNTVFVRPEDGFPVYHVETPMRFFGSATTTIKKINGATDNVMATIGLHAFSQEVNVWGRNITPVRAHMFTTSEKFIASDGRSYKWKTDWGIFQLILNDRSHTPIAFYDSGSLGILSAARLPSLQTTPDGVPIIDEIVATFIYVLQNVNSSDLMYWVLGVLASALGLQWKVLEIHRVKKLKHFQLETAATVKLVRPPDDLRALFDDGMGIQIGAMGVQGARRVTAMKD